MKDSEILDTILTHGLSVRQIPLIVTHTYSLRALKEGDEIIKQPLKVVKELYLNYKEKHRERKDLEFNDTERTVNILYCRRYTTPEKAGYWMCKQVKNTSSTVAWSYKTDNLAPTLEKSIKLFLESLK